jgi:hypothetical protein
MVMWVRNINATVQELDRTAAETSAITAGYRAEEAEDNYRAKVFATLAEAIDDEDPERSERRLDNLRKVTPHRRRT